MQRLAVTLTATDDGGGTATSTETVSVVEPNLRPIAGFTYDCTGLTCSFTDTSTDSDGTVVSWSWDFGDGSGTSTVQNPSYTYAAAGTFNVTLTVTDNSGGTDFQTQPVTVTAGNPGDVIYLTAGNTSGSVGGITFKDEDIIAYDVGTDTWSLFFDGGDVGLGGSNARDINGLTVLANGDILFSVKGQSTIPDVGTVNAYDIIRFTGTTGPNTSGTFSLYLDGASVGLIGENINGISFAPDGRLIVSLSDAFSVPGVSGRDEDLIALDLSGTAWSMYIDGSDVALNTTSDEDIEGVWVDSATGDTYLTTKGPFSVPGASGDASDIFVCTNGSYGTTTSCTFASYWVGALHGLAGIDVIGIHVER